MKGFEMKKYDVVEHSLEFRTNKDESWTSEEIKQAFENEDIVEPRTLATFDSLEEAREYLKTCEPTWSKSSTSNGFVLNGYIYGIEFADEENDEFGVCDYKYGNYEEKA